MAYRQEAKISLKFLVYFDTIVIFQGLMRKSMRVPMGGSQSYFILNYFAISYFILNFLPSYLTNMVIKGFRSNHTSYLIFGPNHTSYLFFYPNHT